MALSNKKQIETSSNSQNSVRNTSNSVAPTNPSWVTDSVQNLLSQINGLGGTSPSQYVAPASNLQEKAFQAANGLSPSGNWGAAVGAVQAANSATTPEVNAARISPVSGYGAASLLDGLENYVNPELNNVVRTTLTNFDEAAGQSRAQMAARAALNKSFGGSRAGLAAEQFERGILNDRASTESGLRSNAYDKAFQYSNMDAQRRQQAAADYAAAQNAAGLAQAQLNQQAGIYNADSRNKVIDRYLSSAGILGGLASSEDASARSNIGLIGDLGGIQRDIAQASATSPISLLQAQQSLLAGLPLNLFNGQNSTGYSNEQTDGNERTEKWVQPSTLDRIGQGAQLASSLASLFSDRRLKRNIKPLGKRGDHHWYSYNYVWGGKRQEGVMADEVMKIKPDAVSRHENGYLMVDYGRL